MWPTRLSPSYGLHYSLETPVSLPPAFIVYTLADNTAPNHKPTLPPPSPHHPPSLSSVSVTTTLTSTPLLAVSLTFMSHVMCVSCHTNSHTRTFITAVPPRALPPTHMPTLSPVPVPLTHITYHSQRLHCLPSHLHYCCVPPTNPHGALDPQGLGHLLSCLHCFVVSDPLSHPQSLSVCAGQPAVMATEHLKSG